MSIQELVNGFVNDLAPRIGTSLMKPIRATLGRPTDNTVWANDTNRGQYVEVFVHLETSDDPTSYTTALRGSFTRKDVYVGRPVLVTINDYGDYVLDKVDAERDAVFSEGIEELDDQSPVYLRQLVELASLHPVAGSLSLRVAPAIFSDGRYVGGDTPDFSSGTVQDTSAANITIPTTNGQAKGVLVQLDATTGTLTYKQSSEFSAILSLAQAYSAGLLPVADTTKWRIGYAKLVTGITEFTYDHILQAPELLSKGGNTSFPEPITATYTIAAGYSETQSNVQIADGGELIIEGSLYIV